MSRSLRFGSFSRHRRSSVRIAAGVAAGNALQSGSFVMTKAIVAETSSASKARAPAEPWAILAFGTFAAGIYAYRIYAWRKEQRLADALAEARISERLSRIVLALQDLANTPLQTLELTSALLARGGAAPPLIDRMQRALARLRDLNRIMAHYSPKRPVWQGPASLDSRSVLQRDENIPHDRLGDEAIGPPPGAG